MNNDLTEPSVAVTSKRLRLGYAQLSVIFMIFALVTINYADRGVIGSVAPKLRESMNLSTAQFGYVASAFGWGYVPFVFLSGSIVRKAGRRFALYLFVFLWSLFVVGAAVAWSYASLVIARVLFGAAEGAIFPIGSQLIADYVAKEWRGVATAFMAVGIPCGALVATPVGAWLSALASWRLPFIVLGVVGFGWLAFWALVAEPRAHESRDATTEGQSGRSMISEKHADQTSFHTVFEQLTILRSKDLWISGFAFFSSAYQLYFMLAFFPSYLIKVRHIHTIGLFGEIPFLGMFFGALISGFLSDAIRAKTGSLYLARSVLAGISLVIAGALIGGLLVFQSETAALILIGLAGFMNFIANPMFFSIPVDLMPRHAAQAASLTTGLGSVAGILAPIVTGLLVQRTGSFDMPFFVVFALPVIFGCALILFVKLDRSPDGPPADRNQSLIPRAN